MPWCIPCHCPDTVKHILLDCIDLRDTRVKYYRNVNTMEKLFIENNFNIINYLNLFIWVLMLLSAHCIGHNTTSSFIHTVGQGSVLQTAD